jgi:DNA repair photolyase
MSSARPHRGATLNRESARFNLPERVEDGDWLDERDELDGAPAPPRTTVTIEHPKTIITHNRSPDIPFDRSINAYRGCEHGCIYCFARPTHAFHDLSPGIDFETKLFAKPDAPALLRAELMKPAYRCAPIAMGTNTDPYQPIERDWNITRACVEILATCRHPLMITTKSDRVMRDIDLLGAMASDGLVSVMVSVTSLDPRIAMTLEPRPVQVSVSPLIPAITDHETEAILEAAANAGAMRASFIPVRLPHEVAPLFRAWLHEHYPERADKVMSIINQLRGGRDNDPEFGSRMRGSGPWYDLMRTRFVIACKRFGLNGPRVELRTDLFRPPEGAQMRLF